jgi:sugar lactone lactonase YvrE
VLAMPGQLGFLVPAETPGGMLPVRLEDVPGAAVLLEVGTPVASGVHQVDNPAIGADGSIYLTCSGTRGQQTPVSVYRVRENGLREVFVTGLTNATSLAIGPGGALYVSSRFDGTVSRVDDEGRAEVVASDLGIACGIAFATDGTMFVGDRSGTVFRIDPGGETHTLASLPASVAAYHLAVANDGTLYVTGPTLSSYDNVYRITPDGTIAIHATGFGRPQGLAVDPRGDVFVVEALAGLAGVYRITDGRPELVVSALSLVGIAFHPQGGFVVASNDAAWRFAGTL